MQEMDDLGLLREYAARKSEAAFETLVSRYINVVYSAALRQAGDPHLAQEITQAVFIILARKAGGMGKGTLLLGWLVRTVRFTASAQIRAAGRRRREQEAQMECSTLEISQDSNWELMSPLLDEALTSLNAPDRQAVSSRYLEQKSLAEVGASLAVNEEAARKRVARALEKLRRFFTKRGVVLTAAVIGGAMSAHAVQAAPAGLAKAVAGMALAHAAAGSSTLTLVKGALKLMAWTKAKMAVAAGLGLLLAAGTTTVVVNYTKIRPSESIYETIFKDPQNNVDALVAAPPTLILRPTRYPKRSGRVLTSMGQGVLVDGTIADLIAWANGSGDVVRLILPDGMPDGYYDYLSTLPGGTSQAREDLQAELKRQFGVVAHFETRATNVLLLKIKDADKLKAHLTRGGRQSSGYGARDNNVRTRYFTNEIVLALLGDLQPLWKKPVLDRTGSQRGQRRGGVASGTAVPGVGSHDNYDFYVEWPEQRWPSESARTESLRQVWTAALDNFGLELVPSREPTPMLVVERVRK